MVTLICSRYRSQHKTGCILFIAMLLANIAGAALTTNNWTLAGSGKWETATNWSLASAPSLSDTADFITNAATKTVTIDATTTNTPGVMTVSNLTIAGTATTTNTLFLNNAGAATPLRILGTNATLALNLGGAVVVNNSSIVATNTVALPGQIYIGNTSGNTSLTISNGGVVYDDNGWLGFTTSSNTVLVTGPGSAWNSTNLFIGLSVGGANQMIISNGGAVYSGGGVVGEGPNSLALVTVPARHGILLTCTSALPPLPTG